MNLTYKIIKTIIMCQIYKVYIVKELVKFTNFAIIKF